MPLLLIQNGGARTADAPVDAVSARPLPRSWHGTTPPWELTAERSRLPHDPSGGGGSAVTESAVPPTPRPVQPTTTAPPATVPPTTTAPPATVPPTTVPEARAVATAPTAAPVAEPAPAAPIPVAGGDSRLGIVTYYGAEPGTCASPTLPFGTVVTVTNPANGASVSCTVDDREADTARQIDLATATFAEIAPLSQGVIPDAELSW